MISSTRRIISDASVADKMICSFTCITTALCYAVAAAAISQLHICALSAAKCAFQYELPGFLAVAHASDEYSTNSWLSAASLCSTRKCPALTCPQLCQVLHLHPCVCCPPHVLLAAVKLALQNPILQPARDTCSETVQCLQCTDRMNDYMQQSLSIVVHSIFAGPTSDQRARCKQWRAAMQCHCYRMYV